MIIHKQTIQIGNQLNKISMTIKSKKRSIKLRSSISEQTPTSSAGANLIEIEGSSQDNFIFIL